MIETAKYPEKLHICVIIQDEMPKWRDYVCIRSSQVELHFFESSWAEGPTKARAEAFKHYNGEKYFFQSDSHMRFVPQWDLKLKLELEGCLAEKPVLTTFPPNFVIATGERYEAEFNELKLHHFYQKIPITVGAAISMKMYKPTAKPLMTPFIAAGVLFSRGTICEDIPCDPYYYFHGEEFSIAMRLWTKGYTSFSPRFCFCYHAYRQYQQHEHHTIQSASPHDSFLNSRSIERCLVLVGLKSSRDALPTSIIHLNKYGLGNVRTINSWESTFGINLREQTAEPRAYYNPDERR